MTTVVPSFIEKTSSASSHTFTAPSGIAGMSGLIVVCTGTSTGSGIAASASGATFVKLDEGAATNVRYTLFRATNLTSGSTVTLTLSGGSNTIGIGQFYTDEHTFPSSMTAGAIRSSSITTSTTNSITPDATGQRVLIVGIERTTDSTTVSSVTSSDGETCTVLLDGEGSGSTMTSSVLIARFDAANTTSHTATIIYSNSSQNGYAALVPLTAVSGGGGGEDPGGGSGGGSGGSTLTPVIRSSSSFGLASGTTTGQCPAPTGIQVGDLLVAIQGGEADNSISAMTAPAFPTVHVAVAPASPSDHSPHIKIYSKVATSSDAAASTFTFNDGAYDGSANSGCVVIMIAIQTGTYSTSTPVTAGTFTEQVRTSTTLQTAPSMTGAVDQLLLATFAGDINNIPASSPYQEYPSSGPAGMTRVRSIRSPGNYILLGAYAQALTSAGATGTRSVTPDNAGTQNGWAAGLIAINPGTVTGGGGGGGGSANTTGFFLTQ